jgi:predicted ATP-grasp superfamily ATP-dependent carboligase
VVDGSLEDGFDTASLMAALADLGAFGPLGPIGIVYGAGFERNPDLLTALSRRWRLLGNSAVTVRRVKDPGEFQAAAQALGIPVPATDCDAREGWLVKDIGGAGGGHIQRCTADAAHFCAEHRGNKYFQEEKAGRAISALFVANGQGAVIRAFSEQWTSPLPDYPFRYGGAAGPVGLSETVARQCGEAVSGLCRTFGLKGIGSADFIVDGENWWLLELNPRPGATLDIFDDATGVLFRDHLRGLDGELPDAPLHADGVAAAATVYADDEGFAAADGSLLPEWVKDRPRPGTQVPGFSPLCTVLARAESVSQAKDLCAVRGTRARTHYYNKIKGN